ncbi:uncharacterized protein Z519_12512 [Cladophialophora bantiana CBS 173.52]|uniref:AB hydrolase-1 domain-containing protein n=1 Tax=Cladophialophora bantiana (strain ATCC 10958 / CBS 173.52 / CDC B-1940 / NIH 8579) TaxID=1442370 RepID=A0A0D2E9U9_CLAB1|nr:uncharacterized protein Z519_12512 [Cladophialophora bantiana CBS 173.52]KIW86891.1 hypothetical protein Z519_12512 [Cladophialophora bantiana CBS 173.52]
MVKHNNAFGQSCLDLSGDFFKHVDTTSVAKNMEAIRVALNDGNLNWLGGSYGTQIGAQYAELYPNNIRAMVLDGDVGHSPSDVYLHAAESSTYENSPWSLLRLGRDKTPISAPGCLTTADISSAGTCFANVTGEDIRFNVQGNSYLTFKNGTSFSPCGWLKLGIALNDTFNGHATPLSSAMANREKNSTVWPGLAVACLDWNHNTATFAQNKYKQQLESAIAPHTKGASQMYQYQTQCIGWPAPVVNQTAMKLAPPILMVNSNHDPKSSYVWAQSLRTQVPSAVLVARSSDGHTSFGLGGQASAVVDADLVNRTLPTPNFVVNVVIFVLCLALGFNRLALFGVFSAQDSVPSTE